MFLHEFDDLLAFYNNKDSHGLGRCEICAPNNFHRNRTFNLGILVIESGRHNSSTVDVWSVCILEHRVQHLGRHEENFLHAQLGFDEHNLDYDNDNSKESMLANFKRERLQMESVQRHFEARHPFNVHAFGQVALTNYIEHIEWNCPAEYAVRISWSDMRFRKIIPQELEDNGQGVERIINEHT
jgi:hypothetical protein